MKNPVLRVRKGVPVYDDSTEEPPPSRPRAPEPPRRRARAAPRRGRLPLLPLVALVLALVIVLRVLPRGSTNHAVIGGWNTTLHAAAYQDAILVSVTFVKEGSGAAAGEVANGPAASVRIVLPDTGQELSLTGVLSRSPITLRGQMDYSAPVRRVQAEVSVDGDRKTLSLTARRPPAR